MSISFNDNVHGSSTAHHIPTAYDVGLNNGDDTAYYLAKGWRVVAIDANPSSCAMARERFPEEVRNGMLTVLNLGVGAVQESRTFFINDAHDAISTFAPEMFENETWVQQMWTPLTACVYPLSELISQYGAPDYAKIDVEFYDHVVLNDLASNNICPLYISVEIRYLETFALLKEMGYSSFQVVPGESIESRFADATIKRRNGELLRHSFTRHSSGPFGDDLPDPWLPADAALQRLLEVGTGWVDVHATKQVMR